MSVCPGCGRCKECGRPLPAPWIPRPWVYPRPWTVPVHPLPPSPYIGDPPGGYGTITIGTSGGSII